ncbi:carboxymuconolactone decarboxylase family protein [Tolypothrix sp. VBCCA 56010]|uniref:carboxymuconolactone decarboxylase family protein n=1 Tax=Tolypothrix sp. VBCCA 56010 TaxID=3137731 RepID=UPI003D7C8ECE
MTLTHELTQDRYTRGLNKLGEIDGEMGQQVIESLKAIAPDFARYLIEFPFKDIYSRPGLDLKSREIATVAALTPLGNAQPQLRVHLQAALNVGCTQQEVIEILIQMAVYAGFPAALRGLFFAQEVFAEFDHVKQPTKSPTEIVQAYFAAFLSGDLETTLSMLNEDVEWHVQGAPNVPTVGTLQGKEQVKAWMLDFPNYFKPLVFEVDRYFESADEVIVTGRFKHLVLSTHREVGSELAIHFRVKDELICSYKILEDSYALYLAFNE